MVSGPSFHKCYCVVRVAGTELDKGKEDTISVLGASVAQRGKQINKQEMTAQSENAAVGVSTGWGGRLGLGVRGYSPAQSRRWQEGHPSRRKPQGRSLQRRQVLTRG